MQKVVGLLVVGGIVVGLLAAAVTLLILPRLPIRPDSPIYQVLGIRKPQIIGFLPYWLLGKAQDSYPREVTTLTYFGLALNPDGTIQKMANPKEEEPGWTALRGDRWKTKMDSAKKLGQKLSLLVQMSGESNIQTLISSPVENGRMIVTQVAPIMKQYGFTDLNLDIESFAEASPSARTQFTQLVQTVTDGIHTQKLGTVTIELSPSAIVKPFMYGPIALGEIVDTIVLMAYDYHYTGSYIAGAVAPLSGAGTVTEFDVTTGVNEALKEIPRNKLVLGIPMYGYTWETLDPKLGAPVVPGSGYATSYKTFAVTLQNCPNCVVMRDPVTAEPAVSYPSSDAGITKQVFYEDKTAIVAKVELAKTTRMSGVAMWALGYEDGDIMLPISEYAQFFWWEPALTK